MLVDRHGEHFQKAIGILDESAVVVGQDEILSLAPCPLLREQVLEKNLPLLLRWKFVCAALQWPHRHP